MSIAAAVAITISSPHLPAGDMLDQVLDIEPSFDSFCPIYKPGSEGLLLILWATQYLFSISLFHLNKPELVSILMVACPSPYSDESFQLALFCPTLVKDQGFLVTRYQWFWGVVPRHLKVAETISGGLQGKSYFQKIRDIICLFHGVTFSLIHKQWLKQPVPWHKSRQWHQTAVEALFLPSCPHRKNKARFT